MSKRVRKRLTPERLLHLRTGLPGHRPILSDFIEPKVETNLLELSVAACVHVANHVQVVMVDVDNFLGLFVT